MEHPHRSPLFNRIAVAAVASTCLLSAQFLSAAGVIAVPSSRGLISHATPGDFDGDRKFDLAVKHDTGEWTIDFAANEFANSTWDKTYGTYWVDDVPAPADYDGDGKTDFAAKNPVSGLWCIDYASNGFLLNGWDVCYAAYGGSEAHPVPADYDGDGSADLAVKTDVGTWHIDFRSNGYGSWDMNLTGYLGPDAVPVPADYDGDGLADLAVKDGSTGRWYIDYATSPPIVLAQALRTAGVFPPTVPPAFGAFDAVFHMYGPAGAHPVPADYDGDGKADLAVKADWGEWNIDYASNGFGFWDVHLTAYGPEVFHPVPADYDGDGKADLSVFWDFGDWYIDYAVNGFGAWDVLWNPDRVILTPNSILTPRDIRVFDAKWMNDFQIQLWKDRANHAFDLGNLALGPVLNSWGLAERMTAMARMYELTGASRYLKHLHELALIVFAGRDDHSPASGFLLDRFRDNQVMPAWGGQSVGFGLFHHSEVLIAGLYSYPLAAFARIIAENPALHQQYGADARAIAAGVLETFIAFLPELETQRPGGGDWENYWINPPTYNTLLTKERCLWAEQEWLRLFPGSDPEAIHKQEELCVRYGEVGGHPMTHNEYQAFVMALIELPRALDSDLYKRDLTPSERDYTERVARSDLPTIVARAQHYFRNRWELASAPPSDAIKMWLWYYEDDPNPPSWVNHKIYNNDIGHAELNMKYIGLLWRNKARLDGFAASSIHGGDQIELSLLDMQRLTNTFIYRVNNNGMHLTGDLAGGIPTPIDQRDSQCEGFLHLAEFHPLVYTVCETVTLNLYDPSFNFPDGFPAVQPHLGVGNHAALLAAKRFRRR